MPDQLKNSTFPPSTGNHPAILTFKHWLVQIAALRDQKGVQMLNPSAEFGGQMPLEMFETG